ncbi:REP-associated tyrosine transposase [Siphonobacter sp.]|uniref:REP-associated tyrosine transposase n=1 Tax=Siphonobacter sp. TaxID=1869184 RepID=UPI003B3BBD1E
MIFKPYQFSNPRGIYFISFATVYWIDVFTRIHYRTIFLDSLSFCQQHKGLRLHAWCLMSNHVHLIISTEEGFNLSHTLRDLKRHTATTLIEAIKEDPESRKEWMLWMFQRAAHHNKRNDDYQFWQQDNHAEELITPRFTQQKLNYLHQNPVVAGWVDAPEHFLYSSARDYTGFGKGLLDILFLF